MLSDKLYYYSSVAMKMVSFYFYGFHMRLITMGEVWPGRKDPSFVCRTESQSLYFWESHLFYAYSFILYIHTIRIPYSFSFVLKPGTFIVMVIKKCELSKIVTAWDKILCGIVSVFTFWVQIPLKPTTTLIISGLIQKPRTTPSFTSKFRALWL